MYSSLQKGQRNLIIECEEFVYNKMKDEWNSNNLYKMYKSEIYECIYLYILNYTYTF